MMTISIIIPTYNEEENIEKLVRFIKENSNDSVSDIFVSDGGSQDATLEVAIRAGARALVSAGKGRSAQMNFGAAQTTGEILYFIHADCLPPPSFVKDILSAIQQGYDIGRYRSEFNSSKTLLKINAWFTRFDLFIAMGGDQTLFVKRPLFEKCGRFDERMNIMEEYDFCNRARAIGKYRIMKGNALISARKYDTNSWFRVQWANATIVKMFRRGSSQQQMLDTYKRMLAYRKNAF